MPSLAVVLTLTLCFGTQVQPNQEGVLCPWFMTTEWQSLCKTTRQGKQVYQLLYNAGLPLVSASFPTVLTLSVERESEEPSKYCGKSIGTEAKGQSFLGNHFCGDK